MNSIFFTSDLHFGHANIIRYCNRPFSSIEEMNEQLIQNWNSTVQPNDTIYILGDVFFCPVDEAVEILTRLNGIKKLVLGNHDKIIRNQTILKTFFSAILPDLHEDKIDGINVVMCHYPLLTWNRAHHGSFMLHGHCHNNIPFDGKSRRMDVGVDAQGYMPVSWSQIKDQLLTVNSNDVRNR